MTTFTLPTSRPVTQDWAQEFYSFKGVAYPDGFYNSLGWKGHNGIDYGCWIGDPVEAVCDGVIEYVGPGNSHPLLTGGGNTILLRNDDLGIRFEYLHLSQQNVYTGQQVTRRQVIGLSGDSGAATAPHLHVGAIPVGWVDQDDGWRGRVDPTPYLYGAMNPDYPAGLAAQGSITPEENDVGTVESFTPEAMNNLAVMVHTAVKEQLADVVKSVAFQERFSVAMLEKIASQSGVTVDSAAIASDIRAQLAAQIGGTK